MGSFLENMSAQAKLNAFGVEGCNVIAAAVTNRIVTSTNMKVGAYTIAAQPITPAKITCLVTALTGSDTMGTLSIVGTDVNDAIITETITPVVGTTLMTTNLFKTVTSVTGAGWVINTGNDTIVVGVDYSYPPTGYYFCAVQTMAATVVASQTNVTGAKNPTLSAITSIPVGITIYGKYSQIQLTSGQCIGYYARGQ